MAFSIFLKSTSLNVSISIQLKILITLILLFIAVMGIGISFIYQTSFFAFTTIAFILFFIFLLISINETKRVEITDYVVTLYSSKYFPVFRFNLDNNDLEDFNMPSIYKLISFLCVWIWGSIASMFIINTTIGIFISMFIVCYLYIDTKNRISKTKKLFSNSVTSLTDNQINYCYQQSYNKQIRPILEIIDSQKDSSIINNTFLKNLNVSKSKQGLQRQMKKHKKTKKVKELENEINTKLLITSQESESESEIHSGGGSETKSWSGNGVESGSESISGSENGTGNDENISILKNIKIDDIMSGWGQYDLLKKCKKKMNGSKKSDIEWLDLEENFRANMEIGGGHSIPVTYITEMKKKKNHSKKSKKYIEYPNSFNDRGLTDLLLDEFPINKPSKPDFNFENINKNVKENLSDSKNRKEMGKKTEKKIQNKILKNDIQKVNKNQKNDLFHNDINKEDDKKNQNNLKSKTQNSSIDFEIFLNSHKINQNKVGNRKEKDKDKDKDNDKGKEKERKSENYDENSYFKNVEEDYLLLQHFENSKSDQTYLNATQRFLYLVKQTERLLQKLRDNKSQLMKDEFSNVRNLYLHLGELEEQAREEHYIRTRFEAIFQILIILTSRSSHYLFEAEMKEFLEENGMDNLDLNEIYEWEENKLKMFDSKRKQYLKEKYLEKNHSIINQKLEEKALRRRSSFLQNQKSTSIFSQNMDTKLLEEQILEQCIKSGKKFIDNDFPPILSSLVIDQNKIPRKFVKIKSWKRISDNYLNNNTKKLNNIDNRKNDYDNDVYDHENSISNEIDEKNKNENENGNGNGNDNDNKSLEELGLITILSNTKIKNLEQSIRLINKSDDQLNNRIIKKEKIIKKKEKKKNYIRLSQISESSDTLENMDNSNLKKSKLLILENNDSSSNTESDVELKETIFQSDKGINLLNKPLRPENIIQGILGDCYLLSALSVLCSHYGILNNIFITKKYSKYGFYVIQFYVSGKWIPIVIDDYLPYNEDDQLVFAKSKDAKEIWPQLIEKAYAKLFGSYEAIVGGFVHSTLANLTGGSSEMISLLDPDTIHEIHNGRLWNNLLNYYESGYLLGCGSNSGKDSTVSKYGIVYGHAYSVLDVKFVNGIKLIKLRNPWGKHEWNGNFSRNSFSWNKKFKAKLNYDPKKPNNNDKGTFWMTFEDFVKHFRNIYICRLFSPNKWITIRINDQWENLSAGGSTNFDTCVNSPQYWLTIRKPTKCYISLTQEDPKFAKRNYWYIGIIVAKKKGKRIKQLLSSEEVISSGDFTNTHEVFVEVKLQPNFDPYTLFFSTFRPYQEGNFTITLHTNHPVVIEKIPSDVEAD
ncbi:calpain [Anaeramoeba flamelloides]|uniref:Calpain n=1 Tax=Anaeramoeba flamelloides TaxID=1746091 RepID=A0ABQ8XIE4_9EUKA|nr:calpain [Anaeramoeba flamelloides]